MADLDELRRLLRAREALAPDPDGIATAARAHGTRMRRRRLAGAVVASAAAVVVVVALATTVGLPRTGRLPTGGTVGATPTSPVGGGWPAVPRYTVPVVPGSPQVPGPTSGRTAPVSGRAIDPVVPFSLTLPEGWRESEWSYEEGSFRATLEGPESNVELAVVEVLDPASQPPSLLEPSGDPATGTPGPDGSLAWRADPRHFVRLQLQGAPVEMLHAIADTLRFTERPMVAPFTVRYLPPGLHLSGARIMFRLPRKDSGQGAWFVSLFFDSGTGRTTTPWHDLTIQVVGVLDRSSPGAPDGPTTVLAGRDVTVRRLPEQQATAIAVAGVVGQGPAGRAAEHGAVVPLPDRGGRRAGHQRSRRPADLRHAARRPGRAPAGRHADPPARTDQRDDGNLQPGGLVLFGLLTLPCMVINAVVITMVLVRLRPGRRIGLVQRTALAGFGGMHLAFWLVRRTLSRRLRRVLADAAVEPGR